LHESIVLSIAHQKPAAKANAIQSPSHCYGTRRDNAFQRAERAFFLLITRF